MPHERNEATGNGAKYMKDSRASNAPPLSVTVTQREYGLHRHYSPPQDA